MRLRIIGLLCLALVLSGGRVGRMQQDKRQVGLNGATTQRRVAVVIGNGAYTNIKKLKNPVNDATDVAAALQELGFELAGGGPGLNLTQAQMKARIREFGNKLRGGGVGVFYYAGHGIQFNGKNFLLPVDIAIENEADVEDAAVDLQLALNNLAFADNGLNIMILDACRNNPFEGKVRSAADGLAEVRAATGTLIAYATAPGSVASDGTGRNGAYTEALLKQIKQPGVEVLDMFRQVREEVYQASSRKQVPWTNDSLIGKFYFKPADAPKPPIAATKPPPRDEGPEPVITRRDAATIEKEAWGLIRNSTDAQDFRDFLGLYPSGANAGNAKIRLEQLAWEAARSNGGKGALEAYLKEFPTGDNAGTAQLLLKRLERANPPVPVAPASRNTNGGVRQQSNQYGIEFVAISAGRFTMGSPAGENGRLDNEAQHQVTISRPFGLGKYEVKQEQWQAVMGSNPSYFKDCAKCPVESVSWEEVQQFIGKLNGLKDGYTYRLPTEAEWEYAVRAGSTGDYAGILDQMGWYYENAGDKRLSDGSWSMDNLNNNHNKTHPVGMKSPNAWGLYDMHGNVWEWCADWYGVYSSGAVTDPRGASSGAYRVFRGGSWYNPALYTRSAFRLYDSPAARYYALGFRLLRE